jgi:hypothetical protein
MTISLSGPFTFTSSGDFGKLGLTACKHEGTGAGDRFCPPIQGELRWRTPSLPGDANGITNPRVPTNSLTEIRNVRVGKAAALRNL